MLETWYDDKIIIIAINVSNILHIPLSVFYELVLLTSTVMAKLFSVASHRRFFLVKFGPSQPSICRFSDDTVSSEELHTVTVTRSSPPGRGVGGMENSP